jgi:rod shape determining protein RodA
MRPAQQTYFVNIDFITLGLYLALVGIGWLAIYSVDIQQGDGTTDLASFLNTSAGKQTIWIVISFFILTIVTVLIDHKFWSTLAYLMYGLGIALLIAVLFLGTNIKGATAWFTFGGFSFQPSEVAKFGTALALANYLNHWSSDLRQTNSRLIVGAMLLTPMLLILLQPDAGSALVFLGFFVVLFREGLPAMLYIIGIFTGIVLVAGLVVPPWQVIAWLLLLAGAVYATSFPHTLRWLAGIAALSALLYWWVLPQGWALYAAAALGAVFLGLSYWQYQRRQGQMVALIGGLLLWGTLLAHVANYGFNNLLLPHQQERINVWLQPEKCDPRGSLYNVMQSKLAISAGGFTGKGLLHGVLTRGKHVPEQSTDFIFCTIGEEHGFVGSAAVVLLFLGLLMRITILAERQPTVFARAYAYGVAGIIFIHFVVNISMTMGLLPIIGIPLPFVSKGGSSLLGFTLLIAVLLKLDKHRGRIKAAKLPF